VLADTSRTNYVIETPKLVGGLPTYPLAMMLRKFNHTVGLSVVTQIGYKDTEAIRTQFCVLLATLVSEMTYKLIGQ